jgi:hypothetical protein
VTMSSAAIAYRGYGFGDLAIATRGFFGVEVANQVWYPPTLTNTPASPGSCWASAVVSQSVSDPYQAGLSALAYLSPRGEVLGPVAISVGSLSAEPLEWQAWPVTAAQLGSLTVSPIRTLPAELFPSLTIVRVERQQFETSVTPSNLGTLTLGAP